MQGEVVTGRNIEDQRNGYPAPREEMSLPSTPKGSETRELYSSRFLLRILMGVVSRSE
jgi:hypothetical protein